MLKIALAQINSTVGDLAGNTRKILQYAAQAQKEGAELVVFPELALCGYPPEDLLLKKHFVADNIKALDALSKKINDVTVIAGFVDSGAGGKIYNAAAVVGKGKILDIFHKKELPNYGVFDEKRYFSLGQNSGITMVKGVKIGINICEDIWINGAVYQEQARAGAQILINISSSPYQAGKLKLRQELLVGRAKETKTHVMYVNTVGGQDELVFDGGSMIISPSGDLIARARQFEEHLLMAALNPDTRRCSPKGPVFSLSQSPFPTVLRQAQGPGESFIAPLLDEAEEVYKALVLGTRDYAFKNGFKKVALGVSGGVDSALVACIACDAFGSRNVTAISMPSPFNSKATRQDARQLAKNLKIELKEIPIKRIFSSYLKTMAPYFANMPSGIAEENIQARIRGNILMAMANKFGGLILTTGNKSEMAVGYCTLYGDMSGGYAVIKDVFKTKVYELARFRNSISREPLIPESILFRAPSAELKLGQTDEETLGPYEDLDKILMAYIEGHASPQDIVASGKDEKLVWRTIRLVDMNEYKRRQAPPGVKITSCAFGKDWRLPITNRYRE
ncbi:MAG: NAD+ synthase [Candidatus Omnitrophica bacterium]|nr:NAD+ synthase [Candidatus Omnitrophota bacterium]